MLATRKDSPIRNIADLKGKTVGALLGGDPYNVLVQMLRFELGNGDPKAHNITVVNTPTQAQAATIPTGMDAAVLIYPAFLKANAEIGTVGIMNSFGYTESHYKGPAGEGAGHPARVGEEVAVLSRRLLPAPLVLDRPAASWSRSIRASSPRSRWRSRTPWPSSRRWTPGAVSELSRKYWELEPKLGALVVKDDVLFQRGWCWPTEGDAAALLETSKYMVEGKLIPKPLAWSQVRDAFALRPRRCKAAYDKMGRKPDTRRVPGQGREGPARRTRVGPRAAGKSARSRIPTHSTHRSGRNMNVGFIGLGTMGGRWRATS